MATLCQMGTQLFLSPKGHNSAPILGPCLLWPNGWMDQDAAWYGGRPRTRPHCVRWGPSSALKRDTAPPHFSAHVCCGQTTGWIKMPLGMEVHLSPGHIVLHGNPDVPLERAQQPPSFRPVSIVAKWSSISATAEHLLDTLLLCLCYEDCSEQQQCSILMQHRILDHAALQQSKLHIKSLMSLHSLNTHFAKILQTSS